jgi:hypothetical protein
MIVIADYNYLTGRLNWGIGILQRSIAIQTNVKTKKIAIHISAHVLLLLCFDCPIYIPLYYYVIQAIL